MILSMLARAQVATSISSHFHPAGASELCCCFARCMFDVGLRRGARCCRFLCTKYQVNALTTTLLIVQAPSVHRRVESPSDLITFSP